MKKIFDIQLIDPLSFMGPNEKYIKLIDNNFSTNIIVRGSTVKLSGDKKEIKIISKIFNNMINTIEQKGHLEENEIENFIDNTSEDSELLSEESIAKKIILHTYKGIVYAKTVGQKKYLKAVNNHDITFAIGPAGTGKTYTGIALAVRSLKQKEVKRIILTRPALEAGENLGFLPGDLKDKLDPYMQPLYDALKDMIPAIKLKKYIEDGVIQIAPLAFMRGRTLDNAFVILDEGQNTTHSQMKMFLTRMGKNAKFLITGDPGQIDLPGRITSGIKEALLILKDTEGVEIIHLNESDVVRNSLVKKIIDAYKNIENPN